MMPSPAPEQPGLLLRDPYHYSSAILIIPPVLVPALSFLDGEKTPLDLQAFLTRHLGQVVPSEVVETFVKTLQDQGFLETEEFYRQRGALLGVPGEGTPEELTRRLVEELEPRVLAGAGKRT